MENKRPTELMVRNAGLVLLHNYYSMLFEKLGLVTNNAFLNDEAKEKATHYLQYVVTGQYVTEEQYLLLNKVLCGLDINHAIEYGVNMSDEHRRLVNTMLYSVISHWPAIGSCSVNGFRGNWLVRNGVLTEQEDKWELTVEKRAYDILIQKSPFSFSVIAFPWMLKPLHVTWYN
jgi:hypothetical protein